VEEIQKLREDVEGLKGTVSAHGDDLQSLRDRVATLDENFELERLNWKNEMHKLREQMHLEVARLDTATKQFGRNVAGLERTARALEATVGRFEAERKAIEEMRRGKRP